MSLDNQSNNPTNNSNNNSISNHYSSYPSSNQFEITNPSRVLSTPIKTALQAASSKSSIPVLEGILFSLDTEGLTLTGSDLEQWIVVRVDEVKLPLGLTNEPIKFVMPKKVAEAILRLPDGLAVFEFLPERVSLRISYGEKLKNSQTHQLYKADGFIQVPEVRGEEFPFPIDLKRVAFAVGTDQSRTLFTGININFEARKIAATDTHRMVVMDILGEIKIPEEAIKIAPKINMPARMVNAIASLDEPALTVGNGLIKAQSGDKITTIISRLIPGEYPRLSPVVSQVDRPLFVVEVSVREITGTMNRVGLMIPSSKMPSFIFRSDGYITVSAQSESGMVSEDIPYELIGGEVGTEAEGGAEEGSEKVKLECLFSTRQIMDALKHAESEKVTWGLTGQYSPSVIRAAAGAGERQGRRDDKDKGKGKGNDSGDNWLCIIVPGRMGGE